MSGSWHPDDVLADLEPRTWRLELDMLGRPLLSNKVGKMHPIAGNKAREPWRDAATVLARQAGIPRCHKIAVTAQARYKTRRSPSDCDAAAPSVKGVIDGLVNAGIVPDDCPPFIASVTYVSPQVGTGLPDALVVWVREVA